MLLTPGGGRDPRLGGPAALLQQPGAEAAAARLPAPAPLLPPRPRPRPRPRSAGAGQQNCAALSNTSQASNRQASGESRLCTRAGGGENWWRFVRIYANHLIDTDNNDNNVDIVAEESGGWIWDYYITHSEPGPGDNLFINKFISMNNCSSNGASSQ